MIPVRAAVFILCLSAAARAGAQTPDPWSQASWHFGPLAVSPTVAVTNVGIDTNVFNSVQDPKTDLTTTIGPRAEWWLRIGPGRLNGKSSLDFVYFAKYASERGLNQGHSVVAELPFNRVRFFAGAGFVDTNDRPGFEIDARARHNEVQVGGGLEVRILGKTRLALGANETVFRFKGGEVFQGSFLDQVLNRTSASVNASLRHELTPLTTLTLKADLLRERFQHSPDRDSDGARILAGVELDPFALIKGRLSVGYRTLRTPSPSAPDLSGVVASGDLYFVFRGMTRIGFGVSRDVQSSFELREPFYVQSGYSVSAAQVLLARWDAIARAGRYSLAYRSTDEDGNTVAGRVDHFTTWGGGIGYHLGPDTRLGLNLDYFRRQSAVNTRDFKGFRSGLAVTYGF